MIPIKDQYQINFRETTVFWECYPKDLPPGITGQHGDHSWLVHQNIVKFLCFLTNKALTFLWQGPYINNIFISHLHCVVSAVVPQSTLEYSSNL